MWLHENDEIPCDLVLIGTSDPQGICYVEVNDFFLEHAGELRIIILRSRLAGLLHQLQEPFGAVFCQTG